MNFSKSKPNYCHPRAYALFEAQVGRLQQRGALLRAAVAIAMHQMEDVEVEEVEEALFALARRVHARVVGKTHKALLAHAHQVLFEEEGFAGNVEDYYAAENSYLPAVLQSKRGLPITLTLIYKEVLERLGIPVEGINAPGHFLARVKVDWHSRAMLVDPFFNGRVLSRKEAYERIAKVQGTMDASMPALRPASPKVWLARMLQNLQLLFTHARMREEMAAMLELRDLLAERTERA